MMLLAFTVVVGTVGALGTIPVRIEIAVDD